MKEAGQRARRRRTNTRTAPWTAGRRADGAARPRGRPGGPQLRGGSPRGSRASRFADPRGLQGWQRANGASWRHRVRGAEPTRDAGLPAQDREEETGMGKHTECLR